MLVTFLLSYAELSITITELVQLFTNAFHQKRILYIENYIAAKGSILYKAN
jgi:hypothetical protein